MAQPPEATGTLPQEDLPEEGPPPGPAADPWGFGPMAGTASPRHQIRTLFSAAHVLAYQGDQEGCEYVLARLQQTAEGHLIDLREMGVQPEEVVDWRREAMVGAVPLTQLEPTGMFLDNVTGADVRNLQDEYLGSVSDIILDIEEGQPEYVVVARGGFLGIGEDHVLVPWENLSAAPELHVLILDMPDERFAEAPAVDPDVAADAEWMQQYRWQTDDYWQQQREG